mmetsp:Transcript_4665/g.14857  ORF Transcript_4665/g.14857 Transcript_4665/m.14857 type:complete len:233 (+) Transcript_4665:3651-4349(+)
MPLSERTDRSIVEPRAQEYSVGRAASGAVGLAGSRTSQRRGGRSGGLDPALWCRRWPSERCTSAEEARMMGGCGASGKAGSDRSLSVICPSVDFSAPSPAARCEKRRWCSTSLVCRSRGISWRAEWYSIMRSSPPSYSSAVAMLSDFKWSSVPIRCADRVATAHLGIHILSARRMAAVLVACASSTKESEGTPVAERSERDCSKRLLSDPNECPNLAPSRFTCRWTNATTSG